MRADCLVACLPMKEENTVPLPVMNNHSTCSRERDSSVSEVMLHTHFS